MSEPLRLAGRGVDRSGAVVTWTVSEGRRGRRWREVRVASDGAIVSSFLLETAPDGRFAHLELSTAAGLLTLHPEGDGSLHGNAVTDAGVRHLRGLPWEPDGLVLVEGSPVAEAAAGQAIDRRRRGAVGGSRAVLRVALDLGCRVAHEDLAAQPLRSGVAGRPILDQAGDEWPLEDG